MPGSRRTPPLLRIGHGHDVHALHPGRPLVLGGVTIPYAERGFDTHSDGDVLAHALVDALAGAVADGDLGTHFPEDDPMTQDASSINFVRDFMIHVRAVGWDLVNVDCFVTLGTTRLRPHISSMRDRVAQSLKVPVETVSVKARSGDGLGPEGVGEAASATATVLLYRADP